MCMRRNEIINKLIKEKGYKTYLEIGVDNPNNCFNLIEAEKKIGVDPEKGGTIRCTSDQFFERFDQKFDIIFIDGLHHDYQAEKDIENSLKSLNPGGTIVVHDLDPKSEIEQRVPREVGIWTGNVWRAWAKLRATKRSLTMYAIDTDHGVGVIRRGRQSLYTGPYETFNDFKNNREEILNIKKKVF